ncbi:MAG TPA: peptide ABC transporter substrate-binding protein [Candidatus Binatia bacterium]|nr:peptide ABC transporter substrate-binding protein [Candidatus Binatia bacterium]
MYKKFTILSLLIMLSLISASCAPATAPAAQAPIATEPGAPESTEPPAATEPPAPAGPKVLISTFLSGDVATIDPALSEDNNSTQIAQEAFIGVTNLNEVTNLVEPGMAETWDVVDNADGTQTITFHLRDDVPWVRWNGTEVETVKTCDGSADRIVNANDFAYGIYRNQLPANASPYAYLLGFVLKGASDFSNGVTDDFSTVGVKVIDDFTLELTFIDQVAYNAQIAGLWVALAQPKWIIEGDCDGGVEARGERWIEPGFFQSYGPFTLKEWVHDDYISIVKNPFWPGIETIPQPKLDEVIFRMLDEPAQLAEYEAGNVDNVNTPPLSDLDRIKADPALGAELSISPQLCTYYYGFNTKAPVVDDARVRRALSMAVDRQSLIDNVTKSGQQPAQWFARPGLAGSPTMETHPDLGIKYDPETAKAELQSYLDEKGMTADSLDLTLLFNTSTGHQAIAEAIQQMWADILGVNVKLVNQEGAVWLDTIKSRDTPQIYRAGWCLDYPDANNFVRENNAVNGSQNPADENGEPYGGFNWKNEEYERIVLEAAKETDPAKRVDLYAQAEQIAMVDDAIMIPIYWYTDLDLTKPYVVRTYSSTGKQAFEKWDILPH